MTGQPVPPRQVALLDIAEGRLTVAAAADEKGDSEAAHSALDDAMVLLCRDLARPGRQDRGRQTALARRLVEQWGKGSRWTS